MNSNIQTERPIRATMAQITKRIKNELKAAYSGVAWSVKQSAGSNSVHVRWADGPTHEAVEAIAGKYAGGYFDGMTDIYVYTAPYVADGRDWSVSSVLSGRDQSDEARAPFIELIRPYRGDLDDKPDYEVATLARREWVKWDATKTPLPATTAELPSHLAWLAEVEEREMRRAVGDDQRNEDTTNYNDTVAEGLARWARGA